MLQEYDEGMNLCARVCVRERESIFDPHITQTVDVHMDKEHLEKSKEPKEGRQEEANGGTTAKGRLGCCC